jgi:hypothetical protein
MTYVLVDRHYRRMFEWGDHSRSLVERRRKFEVVLEIAR